MKVLVVSKTLVLSGGLFRLLLVVFFEFRGWRFSRKEHVFLGQENSTPDPSCANR